MKKYNYLLITSDQQRADTIGCRNPFIQTPNLDRMAEQGILFERAYTSNPVCTPSRISMLTGHYPSRHGCYTIGTALRKGYETVAEKFTEHGYYTALCGKAHFQPCLSPESEEAAPFIMDREYYKKWDGPYYGFEHAQLVIGHSVESHCPGMHYGVWLEKKGIDPSKYFGMHEYTDFGEWDLPEECSGSAFVCETAIEAMENARKEEKPFYIWASFQDPHNPCFVGERWRNLYRPEDMPVYGYEPGEMEGKPDFYRKMAENGDFGLEEKMNGKNWHCVSNLPFMGKREKQEIMRSYYGMISQMDWYIGRILDYLDENGLRENTIVIFASDHGDYMGNHGLWWKGIPAYEDIQRVPMIVMHPACRTPGKVSKALESTLDIPCTFLAQAGISTVGQQGKEELASWLDAEKTVRDHVFVEFRPSESEFDQITFITDQYKLVMYHDTGWNELYDLSEDPEQKKNLWDCREYEDVRFSLLRQYISAAMEKDGVLQTRMAPA